MIKISAFLGSIPFLLISCFSSSTRNENAENMKSIQLKMRDQTVREIMGTPAKTIVFPRDTSRYSYLYVSPLGYSDDFYIYFDRTDSTVVAIGDGR